MDLAQKLRRNWLWLAAGAMLAALVGMDTFVHLRTSWAVTDYHLTNPPMPDAHSPTGYAGGQRDFVLPYVGMDGYHWILQTQAMLANGDVRVREVDYDNFPFGREVHWSSSFRWWVAALAWLDHLYTGVPPPIAVEEVMPYANTLLVTLIVLITLPVVARRFGAAPAALLAAGMIAILPIYIAFSEGKSDHHGLAVVTTMFTILFLVAGGAGWIRMANAPGGNALASWMPERARARRWFIASGIAGGVGLWVSAASQIPVLAEAGLGALLAGGWFARGTRADASVRPDPSLWRLWGLAGAATSLSLYLLEYFPSDFRLRMEVNHPLYALAWAGGGEIICRLCRWLASGRLAPPPRDWPWLAGAAALVAAPVAVLKFADSTFTVKDMFLYIFHVDYIAEFKSLGQYLAELTWKLRLQAVNPLVLLAVPLIVWLWGGARWVVLGFMLCALTAFVDMETFAVDTTVKAVFESFPGDWRVRTVLWVVVGVLWAAALILAVLPFTGKETRAPAIGRGAAAWLTGLTFLLTLAIAVVWQLPWWSEAHAHRAWTMAFAAQILCLFLIAVQATATGMKLTLAALVSVTVSALLACVPLLFRATLDDATAVPGETAEGGQPPVLPADDVLAAAWVFVAPALLAALSSLWTGWPRMRRATAWTILGAAVGLATLLSLAGVNRAEVSYSIWFGALAALGFAAGLFAWRSREAPMPRHAQALLALSLPACLGTFFLSLWQMRWMEIGYGLWLVALVTLAAILARLTGFAWTAGRVAVATVFLGVAMLLSPVQMVQGWFRTNWRPAMDEIEVMEVITRDVAQRLRARLGDSPGVAISGPTTTTWLIYWGGFKGLGTLYWENLDGLKATADVYSAQTDDEALALVKKYGVTHFVIFPWDDFARPYARLKNGLRKWEEPPPESFVLKNLLTAAPPRWLRPIHYPMPDVPGMRKSTVFIWEVAPEQTPDEAQVRQAQWWGGLGRADKAAALLQEVLRRQPGDLRALTTFARLAAAANHPQSFAQVLERIRANLAAADALSLNDRVDLAAVFRIAQDEPELRRRLAACLPLANTANLRRLDNEGLYNFLNMLQQTGLAGARPGVWDFGRSLLPARGRALLLGEAAATQARERQFARAVNLLRQSLAAQPDNVRSLASLAWILSTSPDDTVRNGREGLELAFKAWQLDKNQHVDIMDTLACAFAETGQFDLAAQLERNALELAQKSQALTLASLYRDRLALFEKNQPYRDAR